MKLTEILKDSNYKLTQFKEEQIVKLENSLIIKDNKGIAVPYCICLVRKKEIKLTPEEAVRQLYLMVLNEEYEYPFERMELEYSVNPLGEIRLFEF